MSDIRVSKINEAYIHIDCDQGILKEMSELFTFDVPGAKFMPSYRNRFWDGKIRLLNPRTRQLYAGLYHKLLEFAKELDYEVESEGFETEELSLEEMREFAASLNIPGITPAEDQLQYCAVAIRNHRAVLVSPTGSGKSLIAYILSQWYSTKTLIVVPTKALVLQMISDFESYGYKEPMHAIMGGRSKTSECNITVSTWQSIYEQEPDFFDDYEVIIGDEAHLFKAKSLVDIMTRAVDTKYRFGMTGTLDGSGVNELVLEGLFGQIVQIKTTSELIKEGRLAELKIKVLVLSHDKEDRKFVGASYPDEIEYLIEHTARNRFIRNLALSLKGNTLVLYTRVEGHGVKLHHIIQQKAPNPESVFLLHGGVSAEERERIRKIIDTLQTSITVASTGVFSTGSNVKRIHNIIFASPSKSRIRVFQSIGRGLRLGELKTSCTLFDIGDDISRGAKKNFTLRHMVDRVKMYNMEKFPYDIHSIKLKGRNS